MNWSCPICPRPQKASPKVEGIIHIHNGYKYHLTPYEEGKIIDLPLECDLERETTKVCLGCREELDISMFNSKLGGLVARCKKCLKKKRTEVFVSTKKEKTGKYFKCAYCGKDIYRRLCHSGKSKDKFCSKEHNILFMKKNAFHKNCKICGEVFYCQPCQITLRNRQTCSRKCRGILKTQIAEAKRANGELTKHQIDRGLRYSKKAEDWRMSVFERDDYTCQECHVRGGKLEAHHIKPFGFFPDLRFDIDNGLTLCQTCHNKTKTDYQKMRVMYSEKSI